MYNVNNDTQPFNSAQVASPAPVVFRTEVRSTNDVAALLGREGAAHLTCVVADRQKAGRGRLGRVWQTLPGHSLAVSFVLRDVPDTLALGACLALQQTLKQLTGHDAAIKWPNDLLWDGAKLAGLLTESHDDGKGSRFYVLGIGVNTSWPETPVDETLHLSTVQDMAGGRVVQREQLLTTLIAQLDKLTDKLRRGGFSALQGLYSEHCITLGQPVTWQQPGGNAVDGIAKEITPQGGLVIETGHGPVECVAGDIVRQATGA